MKKSNKYSPSFCDIIIQVGTQGGHVANMCQAIGVGSRDTFYRWVKEYPEFAEAYETATLYSEAFYERELIKGMLGETEKFNHNTAVLIMQNKFGKHWKPTGKPNTEITINSLTNLDDKALDAKIKKLQSKLEVSDD